MNRHEYNNNNNNRNHEYNHHQQNGFAVPEYPSAPKTSQHLKLGDKDYLVLNRIGAGASSQVYSAYSIKDEKCFALKYIEIKRPEDRTNAHAEVDLLKSLINIERVAAIRQYYSIPRAIYLVMELGEIDLAHLIKKQSEKKWDFAFICYFWEQMVMAVGEIHHMNVVHCDLKPANFVLIKGVLKLIDFGISKALQDDTTNIQKDSQIGTFNYMAPESFRDLSGPSGQDVLVKQGRPSDVWALGCILYLMVYGHTPFSNISMPQKIYCIMDSKYPIPFDKTAGDSIIPQRVISILKSCLQREKYLRPTIDNLLRNPLYEI
ncbi:kinase-like protein [Backusella circina FSU 941]|nr:kinase-like protein [Backusella circina FSU 941]